MHIMQELHTIRPTQDFNHTLHVAPQGPIVFINNIRFYFNYCYYDSKLMERVT